MELLPTFVGCPALDPMREAIAPRVASVAPGREVEVAVVVRSAVDHRADHARSAAAA